MIVGVQIVGLFFGIVMMYLTFLHYKKKYYDITSLLLWTVVWLSMLFVVLFPSTFYGIMESIQVERTADFLVMGALLVFSTVIFYVYSTVKRTENRVTRVVRKLALEKRQK